MLCQTSKVDTSILAKSDSLRVRGFLIFASGKKFYCLDTISFYLIKVIEIWKQVVGKKQVVIFFSEIKCWFLIFLFLHFWDILCVCYYYCRIKNVCKNMSKYYTKETRNEVKMHSNFVVQFCLAFFLQLGMYFQITAGTLKRHTHNHSKSLGALFSLFIFSERKISNLVKICEPSDSLDIQSRRVAS